MITNEILIKAITELSHSGYVHVIAWAILIDVLTGISKAVLLKKGDSSVGLKGLIKHSLVLLLLFALNIYLPIFNFSNIAKAFNVFFIVQYMISILENWTELGLPMFPIVRETLVKINSEMDKKFGEIVKEWLRGSK